MSGLAHYFTELVDGKRRGLGDRLLLGTLQAVSHPYRHLLALRAFGYRQGLLRSYRLPRPVISVGNIGLGGTGKTPTVAWIAQYLMSRGKRVAVLSRGYGGSAMGEPLVVSDGSTLLSTPEQCGDEPYLLARQLPGLLVVTGADRYRAGELALRELNPDIFILDDGFQHLRLRRDLDVLLLDAARPFATGYTLPAGMLREGIDAARRADLVLYTRAAHPGVPNLFPEIPSCWAAHRLTGVRPLEGGDQLGFQFFQGVRVAAFSGIASPASFFTLLEGEGVTLTATLGLPDHVNYGAAEVDTLCRLKETSGAEFLITTAKDAVKLAPFAGRLGPCFVAQLELDLLEGSALRQALDRFV
ncbi:tetraacyldisaccharide 4'-kinase [Geomonas limicola]|uniref:Tetraacyldisaccharide 4'-kinase n=1 Tax=Geomonas limicola TaxID=2740186 RepID=A0A6V8NG34_9BACT|nr:tetraacyldisaccharide 4'-kinase [Geomonas limicola]GFO70717.1 tetraacyldisaccharide 4'-kinase [Geomonas limicola]